MKKFLAILLVLVISGAISACDSSKETIVGLNSVFDDYNEEDNIDSELDDYHHSEEENSTEYTSSNKVIVPPENNVQKGDKVNSNVSSQKGTTSKPNPNITKPNTNKPTVSANPGHTHSYNTRISKEATCTSDGTKTYYCSCGYSYAEIIVRKGHNFIDATCNHPKYCSVCNYQQGATLEHTGGTATCADKAVCTYCGQEYGDKLQHDFLPATCTEPQRCRECNYMVGSEKGHTYSNGKCIECSKEDPSVPKIYMDSLPIKKSGYEITSATKKISGSSLIVTLSGTRYAKQSYNLSVSLQVFNYGYSATTGKASAKFPDVSVGSPFTMTITVENAIRPEYNKYNVWII